MIIQRKKSRITKKRRVNNKRLIAFVSFNLIFTLIMSPFIVFWGPFQNIKKIVVGSISTSRHPQLVRLFLTDTEINRVLESSNSNEDNLINIINHNKSINDTKNGITIESIEGGNYKGKVMIIKDPTRVKVSATSQIGTAGQRLSELVKNQSAIAGINGGGFYDPDGKGNGAFPDGITVHEGRVLHNNIGTKNTNLVGIDFNGQLLLGNFSIKDIEEKQIQEAVSFYPNLIVNGIPQIKGDGGWGIAPRTGIGQRADGSIVFVVIDGRQPTWSLGATLRELMNVFINYGAVNAINLDGGSSSEMVYNNEILNKLWNIFGERYIPTSFVVLPPESGN